MGDRRKSMGVAVAALTLVFFGGVALWLRAGAHDGAAPLHVATPIDAPERGPVATTVAPASPPEVAAPKDIACAPAPSPTPSDEAEARAHLEAARAGGVRVGIAAFNPPGTSPLKQGIIVPDDYVLPKGYARHYQNTDDGKRLQPILMYTPGFTPTDSAGAPIAVPADRIVPPENAPPGMPLQMLQLPK